MKIITNKRKLKIPTKQCETVEEGLEIGKTLSEIVENKGIGLSANQIGINKRVCVVSARSDSEPKILVNPRIISRSMDLITYVEGCMSLPGKRATTARNRTITVRCDNWANDINFGPDAETLNEENYWKDEGLLECVCIQHEIDHLDGKLMTDFGTKVPNKPLESNRIGRNERVMIEKGNETKLVKHKHSDKYIKEGWKII